MPINSESSFGTDGTSDPQTVAIQTLIDGNARPFSSCTQQKMALKTPLQKALQK